MSITIDIEKIEDEIYYYGAKQKTIDLVEEADKLLNWQYSTKEQIQSHAYQISICLEVYDRNLKRDIYFLKNVESVLRERI